MRFCYGFSGPSRNGAQGLSNLMANFTGLQRAHKIYEPEVQEKVISTVWIRASSEILSSVPELFPFPVHSFKIYIILQIILTFCCILAKSLVLVYNHWRTEA